MAVGAVTFFHYKVAITVGQCTYTAYLAFSHELGTVFVQLNIEPRGGA